MSRLYAQLHTQMLATSARNKKLKAEVHQLQEQISTLQNELASRDSSLHESTYEEQHSESLVIGQYSYLDDVQESPRLHKRRKVSGIVIIVA